MAAHGLDLQPPPPPPVDESEDAEDVLEALCPIFWLDYFMLMRGGIFSALALGQDQNLASRHALSRVQLGRRPGTRFSYG